MKIAMQNAETTRRGWWVHAYRLKSYQDPRPFTRRGNFFQVSLLGLLGFGLHVGRDVGFNLSAGVSWIGGCGIGWHPGVDDSPVER